jgi:DNA-binding CsgD family transcriptional regulator
MGTGKTPLSPREIQVVKLLIREYSTREIARQLNIGVRTVDTYRKNIALKTNTSSLIGLAKYAIKKGWMEGFHYRRG